MSYQGRDFSSYQGNLTPADCADIQFAFVKATEGSDYKNPYAPQQVAMLRRCGVLTGYYHFYQPSVANRDQLDNFNRMAQALGPTALPVAVDVEVTDPSGWAALASQVADFLTNIEGWTYPNPNPRSLTYVNLTFYDNLHAQGFPWGRWVWLADPSSPAPTRPCVVWQQAPRAVSATDSKVVDADVFVGSDADWQEFTATASPDPAPAPSVPALSIGEDEMIIWRRADNGAEYAVVGGKVIHLDGPTAQSLADNGYKVIAITPDAAEAAGLTF